MTSFSHNIPPARLVSIHILRRIWSFRDDPFLNKRFHGPCLFLCCETGPFLSERDRQRLDNRSMICASRFDIPTAALARLNLAEATFKWRHMAPTAPDTLWCYTFFMTDPFIVAETPDLYAIGCQPRFATRLVKDEKRRSRAVLIPSFAQLVSWLVGFKSLDFRIVRLTENILVRSG
jgi:hypothetical protein